jgi:hypothetical protein
MKSKAMTSVVWLVIAIAGSSRSVAEPAAPLPGFGHPSKCRTCVSAKDIRAQTGFFVPQHGIVFDFDNGIFWRNSRILVVDFDAAEAVTYRMPPEPDHPTTLVVSGRRTISQAQLVELMKSATTVWNPPIPTKLEPGLTDTFQELDVIDDSTMGRWLEIGGGAPWFVKFRDELTKLVSR